MGNYASSYTDVQPHLGGRTLTASSTVTTTQVNTWITDVEAELDGRLSAIGLSTPVTGTNPIAILKAKVVARVAAKVLGSWRVGTTGQEEAERAVHLKEWDDFVTEINERPDTVATMLAHSPGDSAGTGHLRSYITDNSDGKSIGNGDFDPKFTKDMDF